MRIVNIHEAETHLSRLVDEVSEGEEIVLARAGEPVARLVPVRRASRLRTLGLLAGRLTVPLDFDAPLSEEVVGMFEGDPGASAH